MKKRKRINSVVRLLAKIYDVSYYIAQKYFNKANGIIEQAKEFIIVHKILYPTCA